MTITGSFFFFNLLEADLGLAAEGTGVTGCPIVGAAGGAEVAGTTGAATGFGEASGCVVTTAGVAGVELIVTELMATAATCGCGAGGARGGVVAVGSGTGVGAVDMVMGNEEGRIMKLQMLYQVKRKEKVSLQYPKESKYNLDAIWSHDDRHRSSTRPLGSHGNDFSIPFQKSVQQVSKQVESPNSIQYTVSIKLLAIEVQEQEGRLYRHHGLTSQIHQTKWATCLLSSQFSHACITRWEVFFRHERGGALEAQFPLNVVMVLRTQNL